MIDASGRLFETRSLTRARSDLRTCADLNKYEDSNLTNTTVSEQRDNRKHAHQNEHKRDAGSHRLAADRSSSASPSARAGFSEANGGGETETRRLGDAPRRADGTGWSDAELQCCDVPNSTLARAAASLEIWMVGSAGCTWSCLWCCWFWCCCTCSWCCCCCSWWNWLVATDSETESDDGAATESSGCVADVLRPNDHSPGKPPCMGSDELRGGRTVADASEVPPAGACANEENDDNDDKPAPAFAFAFPFAKGAKGTSPLSELDPMSAGVEAGSADDAGPPATVANDSVVEMPRGTLVDVDRYDSLDRRDSTETARPVLACAAPGTDSDGVPHVYAGSVSAALPALA